MVLSWGITSELNPEFRATMGHLSQIPSRSSPCLLGGKIGSCSPRRSKAQMAFASTGLGTGGRVDDLGRNGVWSCWESPYAGCTIPYIPWNRTFHHFREMVVSAHLKNVKSICEHHLKSQVEEKIMNTWNQKPSFGSDSGFIHDKILKNSELGLG